MERTRSRQCSGKMYYRQPPDVTTSTSPRSVSFLQTQKDGGAKYLFNIGEARLTSRPPGIVAGVSATWYLSEGKAWRNVDSALVDVGPFASRAEVC